MFQVFSAGRALTDRGRLVVALVLALLAIVAGLMVLRTVGFRFDPFDLAARRADRAEAAAAAAQDDGAARRLEVQGERASAQRVDIVVRQAAAAQATITSLAAEARSATDAALPLPAERADRLRAHDRELCRIRPTLAGCPAPAADAAGGRRAVPDLPASRPSDPG